MGASGVSGVVVVDDAADDGLASICHTLPGHGIAVVLLSDFLRQNGFEFVGQAADLRRFSNTAGCQAGQGGRVLDRVVEISPKSLANLDGGEGLLSRGQVSFAYERLLAADRPYQNGEVAYSTVGRLMPLPTQWRIVAESFPDVDVPFYKHGYGPELVASDDFEAPIFKSPFDLYSWKSNTRPTEVVWDQFIVETPAGAPVLSYFFDSEVVTSNLRAGAADLSTYTLARLSDLTRELGRTFHAQVGEALWFVEDSDVVFAAFSHSLAAARRHEAFAPHAEAFLTQYFSANAKL